MEVPLYYDNMNISNVYRHSHTRGHSVCVGSLCQHNQSSVRLSKLTAVLQYSRTSLFRTRLIRSPRYFEGRSNTLGFTLPLYASPVISKPRYFELFFHFPWDFEIAGFDCNCKIDLFTDTAAILNYLDLIRYARLVFTRAFRDNSSSSFPRKRL